MDKVGNNEDNFKNKSVKYVRSSSDLSMALKKHYYHSSCCRYIINDRACKRWYIKHMNYLLTRVGRIIPVGNGESTCVIIWKSKYNSLQRYNCVDYRHIIISRSLQGSNTVHRGQIIIRNYSLNLCENIDRAFT